MPAVQWGPILWGLNAALFVALIVQLRLYIHSRLNRRTQNRREFLEESIGELRSGCVTPDIRVAWEGALLDTDYRAGPGSLVHSIVILARASGEWVDEVRHACSPRINELNTFCELIEEDILRPIDLVSESPELHMQLLEELSLLEPFIWYQATLGGRGRWGFRPLQLLEALVRLRAVSPDPDIRGHLTFGVEDRVIRDFRPISMRRRLAELVISRFAPHTLTVHSKMRQNKQRIRIVDQLGRTAPELHPPAPPHRRPVEW